MLERLPDEVCFQALRLLGLAEQAALCCLSRVYRGEGFGGRDAVWTMLRYQLVGKDAKTASTRSQRRRLSGKDEFLRALASRRSNAEELRARYDALKAPGLAQLRALLEAWAPVDVDHRGSAGCTLLHTVVADARMSHAQTLRCVRELVLRRGAKIDVGNDLDFAPLMSAAALGDARTVAFLLDRGADASARGAHPNGFVGAACRPGSRKRDSREWAECYGHVDVVAVIDAHLQKRGISEFGRSAGMETPPRPRKRRPREAVRYCVEACLHGRENFGDMVACDCENWFHCDCVGLSIKDFNALVRSDVAFVCPACASRPPANALDAGAPTDDAPARGALSPGAQPDALLDSPAPPVDSDLLFATALGPLFFESPAGDLLFE